MGRAEIARCTAGRAARAATALALGLSPLLAGCASPNTYATARTLAPGDVTHTVAVEGIAFNGSQGAGVLPILPTYMLRVGVIDRVDVGARVGSFTELGADLKVNFLRGPLDLAIAGGGEAFIEWHYQPHGDNPPRRTGSRAFFHIPLIASYNFSKSLSLVGTPGIAYIVGNKVSADFVRTMPFDGGTVAARLGVGLDYRWNARRSIHPEITVLQSTSGSQMLVMFGLGFNLGGLPSYDDLEPREPKAARPPEPAVPGSTAPPAQTPPPAQPPPPAPPAPAPAPPAEPTPPPSGTPTQPPPATGTPTQPPPLPSNQPIL